MEMEVLVLTSNVLSSMIWDIIKTGGKLVGEKLFEQLKKWNVSRNQVAIIEQKVNNAPVDSRTDKESFEKFIENDKEILSLLKSINNAAASKETNIKQIIKSNEGTIVGQVIGDLVIGSKENIKKS